VLSHKGDRIDSARLSIVFELLQSTSASSLLLSSIDAARHEFQHHGEELLGRALEIAESIRSGIEGLPGLALMGEEVLDSPGAMAFDPTHVTVDVLGLGLTGYQAADWIRERHHIHVELADERRVMALITYADTDETAGRLVESLTALSQAHAGADPIEPMALASLPGLRMETVMLPRDAYLGETEMVPWREAAGRVSAEMICPYPPGIPITAPGELLIPDVIDYLQQQAAAGVMVEGAADETLARFRVAART
jgi:arginine decarboxylase